MNKKLYRCILAPWAKEAFPHLPAVQEDLFTFDEVLDLNESGYNIYYLPNYPSFYDKSTSPVSGSAIDVFTTVFVDMDLKSGTYASKDAFVEVIMASPLAKVTRLVDSGNGIHVYWSVSDLDAISFLRFQRRLIALFKTDDAIAKIYQLMRVPNTANVKDPQNPKLCLELVSSPEVVYTSEELDKLLPPITPQDEQYCQMHFARTYNLDQKNSVIDDTLPPKFGELLKNNKEVKALWSQTSDDRSKADYRLGHIMYANGFTREEAISVLVNSAKAITRAPMHRVNYAQNIVDKIWTFEITKEPELLSSSVAEILQKSGSTLKGTRFPGPRYLDATEHGFRLGQVIGLVAGSGVGKTALALNMFRDFVKNNPEYTHFFIPLEQPANEIADRWKTMCGADTSLHSKVHIMSNYGDTGTFRNLSFEEIKDYLLSYQKKTNTKIGCVVIDHIGALRKKGARNGENQDLMDICHHMKSFAVETNTLLVMQSQAPREKAGIGDLELNKDAAYGTVFFESYCDYLITLWQPLKRCYSEEACPTVTAFKFCKIRHKRRDKDQIQEDVCYRLYFDPKTEQARELTQDEETSFSFFLQKATNIRKLDRKTDIVPYKSLPWAEQQQNDGKIDSSKNTIRH